MGDQSSFLLKRLMSFAGLFPVGFFLVQHLFSNSYIFVSAKAYNDHTRFLTALPMVVLIELGMIYLPILLHASIGLAIIYKGENNFTGYGRFRNWMFFLQRLTGILALVFIAVHTYTTRIRSFFTGHEITADQISLVLQSRLWFWFYLVGVVGSCFHFANGLWNLLITWGITVGRKAQQASSAIAMGIFVLMGLWGIRILLKFT